MPIQKTCEQCGQEFKTKPCLATTRRFCSMRCKATEQMRRLVAEGTFHKPQKPRRGIETPCEMCGKPVYATAKHRERGGGRFCSMPCQSDWQRKEPVVKACGHCGKEMVLKPSQSPLQFCSRECMGHGKTKRPLDRMHNGKRARKDNVGYVLIWEPEHPNSSHRGWIHEHRLVAEAKIGRHLQPGEEVHHVNAIKDDNRAENLVVLGRQEHAIQTAANNWGRLKQARTLEEELEEYRKRFGPLE